MEMTFPPTPLRTNRVKSGKLVSYYNHSCSKLAYCFDKMAIPSCKIIQIWYQFKPLDTYNTTRGTHELLITEADTVLLLADEQYELGMEKNEFLHTSS